VKVKTEAETETEAPRSKHGFGIVLGIMIAACLVLVVAIVANRGVKDRIAHGEFTLRQASAAAVRISNRDLSFAGADASGMANEDPARSYVGPETPSGDLDQVSVSAAADEWAAAVKVNDACFYLRLAGDETRYGVGTVCTGAEARSADDDRW
jgi:hypothetical protein